MADRIGWELDDPDLFWKLRKALEEGKKIYLSHPANDLSASGPAIERRDGGALVQTNMGVKTVMLAYGGEDERVVIRKSIPGFQYTTISEFISQCQLIAKSKKEKGAKDYTLLDEYRLNAAGRIAFYLRSRN